jgi:transposase
MSLIRCGPNAVNPAHTSRACARCGPRAKENRRTQAEFACTACGHGAHADVNAVTHILRAGLAFRETTQKAVSRRRFALPGMNITSFTRSRKELDRLVRLVAFLHGRRR